jgi:GntR family transcriptional regulator, transcriptional repressor for pyruvate dehydrogenase complex
MNNRKKLTSVVIDGILEMIENEVIKPGGKIPTEFELAKLFNISRTAVREGVRSLTANSILEIKRGKGTYVRDPIPGPIRRPNNTARLSSNRTLLELLEVRLILETEIAALAAKRASQIDIDILYHCVEKLEEAVKQAIKPPEDLGFHLSLAKATQNSALIDLSSIITSFYEDDIYLPDDKDLEEHRAIYVAVRERNASSARSAMKTHLERIRKRYTENEIFLG